MNRIHRARLHPPLSRHPGSAAGRPAGVYYRASLMNEAAAAGAGDVGQSVWLQLVEHLDKVRDPAALPGWLATTTRRECARVLRAVRGPHAGYAVDAGTIPDDQAQMAEQQVLVSERHAALREAFAHLPPCDQQLIALLIQDPPVPYAEIGARLGIPVGSIGPARGRCLDKLRRHPAIAALIDTDVNPAGEMHSQAGAQCDDRQAAVAGGAGRDLTMDEQPGETVTASCGRADVGIVRGVTGVVVASRD